MNIKKCTNVSGRALHLCKKAHCGKWHNLVLFVVRVKHEPIVKWIPIIFSILNRPCSFMVYYYLQLNLCFSVIKLRFSVLFILYVITITQNINLETLLHKSSYVKSLVTFIRRLALIGFPTNGSRPTLLNQLHWFFLGEGGWNTDTLVSRVRSGAHLGFW